MRRSRGWGLGLWLAPALLTGCAGQQAVLDPQSGEAHHLAGLFWFFTAVCAVIWLLVAIAMLVVLARRRKGEAAGPPDEPRQDRVKTVVVGALAAMTVVVLAIFTLTSFYATRGFAHSAPDMLAIKVTGQQWWWQVDYKDPDPTKTFTTANEIHIPVGKPVALELDAGDVIHSFWVPELTGKQDLIPGRTNGIVIKADHPGVYRGQCAEFCGLQHAHMAFQVVAEPDDQFEAWRAHEAQTAQPPADAFQQHGQDVFVQGKCATCHAIVGAAAGGHTAPDLTHFASQKTLAAGLLPNTPNNLSRWIADPQGLKPGVNMPKVALSDTDRNAVVAYLENLK